VVPGNRTVIHPVTRTPCGSAGGTSATAYARHVVDELLSRCVVAYVGTAGRFDRQSPEERVVEHAGADGFELLPTVKEIVEAVYDADPPLYNFRAVSGMGDAVKQFLCERCPELSPEAVDAIANNFAFDYK